MVVHNHSRDPVILSSSDSSIPPLECDPESSSDTEYTSDSSSSDTKYTSDCSLETSPTLRQRIARRPRMLVIGTSGSDDKGPPARRSLSPAVVPPAPRVSSADVCDRTNSCREIGSYSDPILPIIGPTHLQSLHSLHYLFSWYVSFSCLRI